MKNKVIGRDNKINRDEWVSNKIVTLPANTTILDVGAGMMPYKSYCESLDYISQDLCEYNSEQDNIGLKDKNWKISNIDIVSDLFNIPLENNSIDTILCTEVLEHILEPHLSFAEFNRLLKTKGKLILTAPFCSLTHQSPYHYSTGFNKFFYLHWLEYFEFKIIEMIPDGNYFSWLCQEMYRLPHCTNTYTHYKLSSVERESIETTIQLLQKLSEVQENSQELLCYTYFILAEKEKDYIE